MPDFSVEAAMRKKRLEERQRRYAEKLNKSSDAQQEVNVEKPVKQVSPIVENKDEVVDEQVEVLEKSEPIVEQVSEEPQKTPERVYLKPSGRVSSKKEAFVKSLPEGAVTIARQMFPEAKNNKDAVAAYIYHKSLKGYDAPEHIKDMVKSHEKEDTSYESLSAQIQNLNSRLDTFSLYLAELELGLTYLMFDRLGFRRGDIGSVDSINFMENGMDGLLTRLRTSAIQKRNQDGRKKRPMREIK